MSNHTLIRISCKLLILVESRPILNISSISFVLACVCVRVQFKLCLLFRPSLHSKLIYLGSKTNAHTIAIKSTQTHTHAQTQQQQPQKFASESVGRLVQVTTPHPPSHPLRTIFSQCPRILVGCHVNLTPAKHPAPMPPTHTHTHPPPNPCISDECACVVAMRLKRYLEDTKYFMHECAK